jgi:ribosomal protein L7/L12
VRGACGLGLSRACDKFEVADRRTLTIVAANGKQRAGGGGGDVFDVRVVAFAGGSAATLQALQELFGLDRAGAQRLLDNVPLVVRRAAPANEAQTFVEALRGIGAQVALERPGSSPDPQSAPRVAPPPPPGARPAPPPPVRLAPPPPPKPAAGKAPPPPPRDAEPLPRPIMRAPTADLEFDLVSGQGLAEPKSAMQRVSKRAGSRRNEIDFSAEPDTGSLELDMGPGGSSATHNSMPARAATPDRSTAQERVAAKASANDEFAGDRRSETYVPRASMPAIARGGAGPMSKAEVVHKPGIDNSAERTRARQIALLRVLGAVGIGALGVLFDSSIAYGNANLLSVLAHALAIYQLGVGLRGLAP